ncbi:MAG: rod shape-determining protein RodA [Gemmatimonadales bacterium]|nr:MAG: rod shape-determining protein RodA [Gemmatimonadales bacterium]
MTRNPRSRGSPAPSPAPSPPPSPAPASHPADEPAFMTWFRRWAGDPPLVGIALALSLFGIAMIYSAGVLNVPSPVVERAWQRQFMWLGVALVGFTIVSRIPGRWIEWGSLPVYLVGLVALAAALAVGTGAGPAESVGRWISLGPIRFQPSEVAKLAAILGLARYLSSREEGPSSLRELVLPSLVVGVPLGLVVLQPDLGTALAFVGVLFAVLYWAGTPPLHLLLLASPGFALILSFDTRVWSAYFIVLLVAVYLLRFRLYLVESAAVVLANLAAGTVALPVWNSLADYQKNRLLVFLDPGMDPRGAGWNLIQSKVAIGSGGLFGKGFTEGTQKRLDFLPEQHTDFIFSVVGEELGFVGATLVLVVFGLLLLRLVQLAERTADPFAGLVLFGIFGVWLVHIFINVGMTVGIVPITGIPLPFLSYGGTFLVTCWALTGLAVRMAREE